MNLEFNAMLLRALTFFWLIQCDLSAQVLGTGSGFFATPDRVVTCAHCVTGSSRILLIRPDDTRVEGRVVFVDHALDVAVLATDRPSESTLGFGDEEAVRLLDDLFVFGFPLASTLGSEMSATQGKLNARRTMGGQRWLQLDATINPGNSGGPVMNAAGQVVGITVARLDPLKAAKEYGTIPERINFAIPSGQVRALLRSAGIITPLLPPAPAIEDMVTRARAATVLILALGSEGLNSAQPSGKTQSGRIARAEEQLRAAGALYIVSGNATDVERELEPYADIVEFYDKGPLTRDAVRADIERERRKWPSRHYTVTRIVRASYNPANDGGSVIVNFSFAVTNGHKHRTGTAEALIVFRTVSTDPKVVMVIEHKKR